MAMTMTNDDDDIGKSDILSHFVRFLPRNIGDIGLLLRQIVIA